MGVTKRAGRRKDAGGQAGSRAGPTRAVFESSKKKEIGLSDLTLVSKITNEAINDNLKIRFEAAEIYTYIGHVLVSVNPFRQLGIYSDQVKEKYEGKNRLEAPPHVYAVAENAYHQMQHYEDNQCVIISGESGAGKTEAAKKLMEYIVYRTAKDEARLESQMERAGGRSKSSGQSQDIKDKVLATNPLLEAFGNAKTLRNNNSSRFGKYLEVQFKSSAGDVRRATKARALSEEDEEGSGSLNLLEPIGASIKNYLLEKSRVVGQTTNERNFHIFYQFSKAVVSRHKRAAHYQELFGITGPETYEYLRKSKCLEVSGIDDLADFEDVMKAMDTIRVAEDDRDNIFRVLATILWLGNVSFVEDDQGNAAIRDPGNTQYVAYLLQVEHDSVVQALTLRHLETGASRQQGESFEVPLNIVQATAVRDALSKALYFNLFDWIVRRLNGSLQAPTHIPVDNSIGILDIYGFEIFERNSFEQLCINYVNEKLQQIFIQLTLKTEQEEYAREKIQWTPIKYFDNKIVCDLIEERRPPGLFSALNDACATAHADSSAADGTFVQRLNGLSNPHFQPRQGQFIVKHYAGDVHYAIDGMTDKNKDQVLKDLLYLVKGEAKTGRKGSQNNLIQQLFPEQINQDDRRRPPTAGDKIKVSANDLVTTLMKCSPSYIRTIKPNENKSPSEYDSNSVLHQIKYLGLQENVRIRRSGFAYRQPFDKFFRRFYPLSPTLSPGVDIRKDWLRKYGEDFLEGTKSILKDTRIPQDQYQIGTTKVFIKNPETIFALEDKRDQHYATLVSRIQRRQRQRKGNRVTESQELRAQGHRLVEGRKERRRFSLIGYRRFMGDYLGMNVKGGYGELVRSAINLSGHEKVVFSAKCDLLVTKFGRSSKPENRTLVLTNKSVYIITVAVVNNQASLQVEREIPLGAINFISASNLKDDWFSIGVGSQKEADPLISCIFKTEFFTHVKVQKPGGALDIRIGQSIEYNKKPGKLATVKTARDPTVQRDDFYKSGTIHTGPGEPANSRYKETPKTRAELERPPDDDDDDVYIPPPRKTPAQRSTPTPSVAQAARASAVAQSNSFATQANPVAAIPNPRIPQMNGFTQKQETRASIPPPAPPPAPVLPAGPKKDYLKALYDFDGANAGNFKISQGEIFESLKEEQNGWSHVKRETTGQEGWAPVSYLEKYTPPAPPPTVIVRPPPAPPAPSLPTRTNPIPTPPLQINGSRDNTPSPEPGAKGRAPPPLPSKRPVVRGKKPAPPPAPRDSAVSLGTSASGSGRATPEGSESSKAPSDTASSLAEMIRARQMKMQPAKNDDDWD